MRAVNRFMTAEELNAAIDESIKAGADGVTVTVPMPEGGWPRFDVLHGYAIIETPREHPEFFALLNMPGAE